MTKMVRVENQLEFMQYTTEPNEQYINRTRTVSSIDGAIGINRGATVCVDGARMTVMVMEGDDACFNDGRR